MKWEAMHLLWPNFVSPSRGLVASGGVRCSRQEGSEHLDLIRSCLPGFWLFEELKDFNY